ncbi:MAG: S26 family signal peptidase [Candidatus Diapherotrites archaeon]|nr:S26 family signal peptidase [Candidatus Diapherotrites archaeon]
MLRKLKQKLRFLRYADPFFYVDRYLMPFLNPEKDSKKEFVINFFSAAFFAFLFYFILSVLLATSVPVSVVMSPSMEPVLYRGDVVIAAAANLDDFAELPMVELNRNLKNTFLYEFAKPIYEESAANNLKKQIKELQIGSKRIKIEKKGPIVIYHSALLNRQIIHRAVVLLKAKDGYFVLTKGDSIYNSTIDQDCGRVFLGMPQKACITLFPVALDEIKGKLILKIPLVGCIKLWLIDDPLSLIFYGRLPEDFKGIC